ncbi:Protein detoxification 20 [Vitis vinifera]|uniref:Protein detoxification 20 n=1 Tax=Vitis vinifera TaxID=29760 RepID=A0A438FS38_VITVI|nr:Protein detoxification 20 [Vitis vinifera]
MYNILTGVAVGAGWQSIVAYVNIASYYLIGIPIGAVLGYILHLQVKGVWIGMLIGTFLQTVVLVIITYRTDWEKQVSIARARISKWTVKDFSDAGLMHKMLETSHYYSLYEEKIFALYDLGFHIFAKS